MAEERAKLGHPFWSYRYGLLPSQGQRYLVWRHRQCAKDVRGKDILDVPSGEGLGLRYLRSARAITCLDYDANAVETAKRQAPNVVRGVCASMAEMPLADESFDCVVSLEGLEHLEKQDGVRFLAEVDRVLRPGGVFLLSCPLSVNGRHSGNQFHLHEWTWDDLQEVLQYGFEINRVVRRRAVGDVVWTRLLKRSGQRATDGWAQSFAAITANAVTHSVESVAKWLLSVDSPDGSTLYSDGEPSLLPTCFSVLARETIGNLPEQKRRDDLIASIKNQQDPETGLFVPGDIQRRDLSSHSATYIRMQATYFAIHALNALGTEPQRPIRLTDQLCDISYLRGWLDGGPWRSPWLHSNNIMFALTFLEHRHRTTGCPEAIAAFDAILDYLDERQDAETGLWQPDDGVDIPNAVYAAYHFFPYYFWRGRQPAYIDRIIDSTLSIQHPHGLYTKNGGACEDLDAVHTLVMMSLVSNHRAEDVRKSLQRCFWRLLQIQNDDGGFPNALYQHQGRKTWKRRVLETVAPLPMVPARIKRRAQARRVPEWRYSGWSVLHCPQGASDTWSGWFRPLALKLIAGRYPDDLPEWNQGQYRAIPGLGWHDEDAIRSAAPVTGQAEPAHSTQSVPATV